MKWTDLTVEQRSSQKLRFNILAKLAEGGSISPEELDDILSQINALKLREQALESYVKFTVVLELNDTYANPVLTFDGDEISAAADGKYYINDVSTGTYYVEAQATGTEAYAKYMRFDIVNKTATIELEPIEGPFIATINTTPAPSSAMTLKFDGVQQVASAGKYTISNVTAGQHQIDIDCTGYLAYHQRVNFDPVHPTVNIELEPEPTFTFKATVDPYNWWTSVYIDGKSTTYDSTNNVFYRDGIKEGQHTITIDNEGWIGIQELTELTEADHERTYTMTPEGNDFTINFPRAYPNVKVMVEEEEATMVTPTKYVLPNLQTGDYDVTITADGYRDYTWRPFVTAYDHTYDIALQYDAYFVLNPDLPEQTAISFDRHAPTREGDRYKYARFDDNPHKVYIHTTGYRIINEEMSFPIENNPHTIELEPAENTSFTVNITPVEGAEPVVKLNGDATAWDTIDHEHGLYVIDSIQEDNVTVSVTKEGYQDKQVSHDLTIYTNELNIELYGEDTEKVAIEVLPNDVLNAPTAKLDGEDLPQIGPYTWEKYGVSIGAHTVEATKPGYEDKTQTINVVKDSANIFMIRPTRLPKQDVTVNVTPATGSAPTLKIDYVQILYETNKFIATGIQSGNHIFEISKPGYKPYNEILLVDPDHNTFNIELEPED